MSRPVSLVILAILSAGCTEPQQGTIHACIRVRGVDLACATDLAVLYDGGGLPDVEDVVAIDSGTGSEADSGADDADPDASHEGTSDAGADSTDGGNDAAVAGAIDGGQDGQDAGLPWRLPCDAPTRTVVPIAGPVLVAGVEHRLELRADGWTNLAHSYVDVIPSPTVSIEGGAPGARLVVRLDSRGSAIRSLGVSARVPGPFEIVIAPQTAAHRRYVVRASAASPRLTVSRIISMPREGVSSRYGVEVCTAREGESVTAVVSHGSADTAVTAAANVGTSCPIEYRGAAVLRWRGVHPTTEWRLATADARARVELDTPDRVIEVMLADPDTATVSAATDRTVTRFSARVVARVARASGCAESVVDGARLAIRPADERVAIVEPSIVTDPTGRFTAHLRAPASIVAIPLVISVDDTFVLPWTVQ